jgi:hypothetical protein
MPNCDYTVDEFCAAERISKVMLYAKWRLGIGPRFYLNGRRRIITHTARIEWQREREAATPIAMGAAANEMEAPV